MEVYVVVVHCKLLDQPIKHLASKYIGYDMSAKRLLHLTFNFSSTSCTAIYQHGG